MQNTRVIPDAAAGGQSSIWTEECREESISTPLGCFPPPVGCFFLDPNYEYTYSSMVLVQTVF